MIQSLRSDDVSVGDLFSGHQLYEIPAFQREYSWTDLQAQRLYDDILAAFDTALETEAPLPLFLGTMLFVASDEPDASVRSALVVDGQQRLVTLTILLSVLRDQLPEDAAAWLHTRIALLSAGDAHAFDTFHVRPRPGDARFLERAVQRSGATRLPRGKADLKPSNEPQRRMEAVRAFFAKRIKTTERPRRRQLAEFIVANCRVLRLWAPDIDYAYRLFLSINRPGLPLSDEDIVLAEVVGPLAVDQRRRYETIIAQMTRYREPPKKGRRLDKTFFTHLAVAQRWSRSDRMITLLRRVVAREGGPMRFAANVFEPMAEAYLMTRGDWPREALPEAAWDLIDGLRLLERFCDSEWVAPAMLAIHRLRDDPDRLVAFLAALDRMAHVLVLTRPTADDRRQTYKPVLDDMWRNETLPDPEVVMPRDAAREASALRRAALRINDAANGAEKAILVRLDAHLSGRPVSHYLDIIEDKFNGDRMLTLEHVLPTGETLARTSGWRPEFAQIRYRRAMSNTIANLILLEDDRNRAAGQADFHDKKATYFDGETPHDLLLTEAVRAEPVWTRETLAHRYAMMMAAFQEVFGLAGDIPELPPLPGSTSPDAETDTGNETDAEIEPATDPATGAVALSQAPLPPAVPTVRLGAVEPPPLPPEAAPPSPPKHSTSPLRLAFLGKKSKRNRKPRA